MILSPLSFIRRELINANLEVNAVWLAVKSSSLLEGGGGRIR
jgi:hypothetical protein